MTSDKSCRLLTALWQLLCVDFSFNCCGFAFWHICQPQAQPTSLPLPLPLSELPSPSPAAQKGCLRGRPRGWGRATNLVCAGCVRNVYYLLADMCVRRCASVPVCVRVYLCVRVCLWVCVCDSRWGLKPVGIIINARAKSFVRATQQQQQQHLQGKCVCVSVCAGCVCAGVRACKCVLSDMCQNWKTTRICVKYPCQRVSSATQESVSLCVCVCWACRARKDKYLKLEIVGMCRKSCSPSPPHPLQVLHTLRTRCGNCCHTLGVANWKALQVSD